MMKVDCLSVDSASAALLDLRGSSAARQGPSSTYPLPTTPRVAAEIRYRDHHTALTAFLRQASAGIRFCYDDVGVLVSALCSCRALPPFSYGVDLFSSYTATAQPYVYSCVAPPHRQLPVSYIGIIDRTTE